MRKKNFSLSVDPKYYTEEYFLSWGNYSDFLKSQGTKIDKEYKRVIDISQIKPGMKILDLGCGRGEILVRFARLGAIVEGVDFAEAAIKLSQESILNQHKKIRDRISLKQTDFKNLNLPKNCYDRIFLMQVIEHLRSWEIDFLLPKIKKSLKDSGFLIIYTYPNRLAFYGFSLYKLWHYLIYRKPPKEKIKDDYYDPIMHINEQTPFLLKRILKKHRFGYQVWSEGGWFVEMLEQGAKSSRTKKIIIALLRLWPFRPFFLIDIYALAWRKKCKGKKEF